MEKGELSRSEFIWALGSLCALHRRPFDPELLIKQFHPPYNEDSLVSAGRALGFKTSARSIRFESLGGLHLPLLVQLHGTEDADNEQQPDSFGLLIQFKDGEAVYFPAGGNEPVTATSDALSEKFTGRVILIHPEG